MMAPLSKQGLPDKVASDCPSSSSVNLWVLMASEGSGPAGTPLAPHPPAVESPAALIHGNGFAEAMSTSLSAPRTDTVLEMCRKH